MQPARPAQRERAAQPAATPSRQEAGPPRRRKTDHGFPDDAPSENSLEGCVSRKASAPHSAQKSSSASHYTRPAGSRPTASSENRPRFSRRRPSENSLEGCVSRKVSPTTSGLLEPAGQHERSQHRRLRPPGGWLYRGPAEASSPRHRRSASEAGCPYERR